MHPHKSLAEYEASLSIPREGEVPDLDPEEIAAITRVVFAPNDPGPADVLFVFGTVQGDWPGMARLLADGSVPRAVLTGLVGPDLYETGEPIAHTLRRHFLEQGVDPSKLSVQDRSTNTLEDVEFALPLLEGVRSILYFAKAHHSGRCLLTLRRFFPDIPIRAMTIDAHYGDIVVDAATWPKTQTARARVYGEYRRILTYSARGDIATP